MRFILLGLEAGVVTGVVAGVEAYVVATIVAASIAASSCLVTRLPGCLNINPCLLGSCILHGRAYNSVAIILGASLAYGEPYIVGTFWMLKARV